MDLYDFSPPFIHRGFSKVWNSELALVAKDWASRCAAMHRPGHDRVNRAGFNVIGENIWWSSESYLRRDLASIVRSLYDEKPFFSYSSNWCQPGQMCGHYTQVGVSQKLVCISHVFIAE